MSRFDGFVSRIGVFGELIAFLWRARRWWLIPVVVLLMLFAVLAIGGSSTGIAPFIYTIF